VASHAPLSLAQQPVLSAAPAPAFLSARPVVVSQHVAGGLPWLTQQAAEEMLAASRAASAANLVERLDRLEERLEDEVADDLDELFDITDNLRNLEAVAGKTDLFRFLPGLHLSDDNLQLITRASSYRGCDTWDDMTAAERSIYVTRDRMKPRHYPWLFEGYTGNEDFDVMLAKTSLQGKIVGQRAATASRGETCRLQEDALRAAALTAGYFPSDGGASISCVDDLAVGQFSVGERTIRDDDGNSLGKADHVLRLANGKLVIVEAKYSGSSVNSHKRLGHECENKVIRWKKHFGDDAEVVILFAGVTDYTRVNDLQKLGAKFIFEHDLSSYIDWLQAAANTGK
jgi:hypothetical protein